MRINLDALLYAVGEAKHREFPCELDQLEDLVCAVAGEKINLSSPSFFHECIVAGLIVLQQHPVLDNVQFPELLGSNEEYATWLRHEKARLKLKDAYDIQPPATLVLTAACSQAIAIAKRKRTP